MLLLALAGDNVGARDAAERAISLARRLELVLIEVSAQENLAFVEAREGRLERAVALAEKAIADRARHGSDVWSSKTLATSRSGTRCWARWTRRARRCGDCSPTTTPLPRERSGRNTVTGRPRRCCGSTASPTGPRGARSRTRDHRCNGRSSRGRRSPSVSVHSVAHRHRRSGARRVARTAALLTVRPSITERLGTMRERRRTMGATALRVRLAGAAGESVQ